MKNRHKLLLVAQELHKRGYGNLRVVPSLSPSGMSWRCSFVDKQSKSEFIVSNWVYKHEDGALNGEIIISVEELTDVFIRENEDFIALCKGEDERYTTWYSKMVSQLEEDELPYAFADYFSSSGFWKTSEGKEIQTLPGEEKYYFNY